MIELFRPTYRYVTPKPEDACIICLEAIDQRNRRAVEHWLGYGYGHSMHRRCIRRLQRHGYTHCPCQDGVPLQRSPPPLSQRVKQSLPSVGNAGRLALIAGAAFANFSALLPKFCEHLGYQAWRLGPDLTAPAVQTYLAGLNVLITREDARIVATLVTPLLTAGAFNQAAALVGSRFAWPAKMTAVLAYMGSSMNAILQILFGSNWRMAAGVVGLTETSTTLFLHREEIADIVEPFIPEGWFVD